MIRRLLLALAAICWAEQAQAASCNAANTYSFAFSSQPATTLAYGSNYNFTATSGGGATRTFNVALAQNGLSSTQVAGNTMPAISTLVTGSNAANRDLVIGGVFSVRTADITSNTRVISVTFTFATPVRDIAFTLHDIDFTNNQYRDWFYVTGSSSSGTYTGSLTLGSANVATALGPTSTPISLGAGQAAGTGSSGNNSEDGTITASFAQPVTTVTLKYGNYPFTGSESNSGQQATGIAGISFCPMPAVSMTKTSAPVAGALGAYNLPSNDVIYTLSVTNTGGSTVDAGTIVLTDVMPANVTFKNSAFDGTTTLPVKLVGSAGVTLASANITYRKVATSTFTYTPGAGYDSQVAEIKVIPGGTMAANSSFQIQFKVKIN